MDTTEAQRIAAHIRGKKHRRCEICRAFSSATLVSRNQDGSLQVTVTR